VSEDYGRSWSAIVEGLPDGWSVNVITEHHRSPSLLFLGNEVGVYVSVDRGRRWVRLEGNLPTVPVDDIVVHPRENDLIVGTHGRSVWIMADVTPLEELSSAALAQAGHVFPIRRSIMWAQRGDWPFYGATYSAPNPPRGAQIRYYLREAVDGDLELTVRDQSGAVVRSLEAPGEAGINEVVWDWRRDRPYEPAGGGGRGGGGGGGGRGGAPQGPIVLPGTYEVSMTVGEASYSGTVEIAADPRRPMTPADRSARQGALMALHVLAAPLYEAGEAAGRVGDQLDDAEALLDAAGEAPADLSDELEAIRAELDEIEDDLGTVRQNANVASAIQGSSTLPTDDQLWQVDRAWELASEVVARLNTLLRDRMPALNAELYADGLEPEAGEVIGMPERPGR
jgi:hypothetical protein